MKLCKICNTEKPFSEFYKNATKKDGLQYRCKVCMNRYTSWHHAENKDSINARKADYYEQNKDHISARQARYYIENRERQLAVQAVYTAANKEKISARNAAYAKAHPEIGRLSRRKRRAMILNAEGTHTHLDVERLFDLQRGKCATCACSLKKKGKNVYHVDHIMPLIRGGGNGPDNLQLLCPPCNLKKNAKHPLDWAKQNGKLL